MKEVQLLPTKRQGIKIQSIWEVAGGAINHSSQPNEIPTKFQHHEQPGDLMASASIRLVKEKRASSNRHTGQLTRTYEHFISTCNGTPTCKFKRRRPASIAHVHSPPPRARVRAVLAEQRGEGAHESSCCVALSRKSVMA
jgi:hypothetical protein